MRHENFLINRIEERENIFCKVYHNSHRELAFLIPCYSYIKLSAKDNMWRGYSPYLVNRNFTFSVFCYTYRIPLIAWEALLMKLLQVWRQACSHVDSWHIAVQNCIVAVAYPEHSHLWFAMSAQVVNNSAEIGVRFCASLNKFWEYPYWLPREFVTRGSN